MTQASIEYYSQEKSQQLIPDTEEKRAALQRQLERVRGQLAVQAKGVRAEPEVVYDGDGGGES